jgi:hypothetical protein
VLWLPDPTAAEACVTVEAGRWMIEMASGRIAVEDRSVLEVGGVSLTLELPPMGSDEQLSTHRSDESLAADDFGLRFTVSTDEEHVAVEASYLGSAVPLGARAHNYALLLLARRRLEEREHPSAGWLYPDELQAMLGCDRESVNLLLWRAKQQFKRSGLPAERLIERRSDTRQLRLGVERIECESV